MRTASCAFVLLFAASFAPLCHGETSAPQQQTTDLNRLRQLVDRQGKKLEEQQRQIEKLRNRIGAEDADLDIRGGQSPASQTQAEPSSETAVPEAKEKARKRPAQTAEQAPRQPVGRPPEKKPISQQYKEIEAIFTQQGVLTPRNTLVIEPSFQYSFSSSTRVVITGYTIPAALAIGLIDVRNINRHTYTPALTLRYGITNRLELNVYTPYVFRDDSAAIPLSQALPEDTPRVFNADGNHLGDVQFGLRYQFNMPRGGGPIFIGGLLAKSDTGKDPFHVPTVSFQGTDFETELPTGTGFWALQPSISAIFPSDPVVFFGSINYLYNFERKYPRFGNIEPGNTFGFNFGMGFSMNERTSFSVGYEHYIIDRTRLNGEVPPGAQSTTLGSLLFGASYRLSDKVGINFSLSAGITESTPDVQLTLRLPFSI